MVVHSKHRGDGGKLVNMGVKPDFTVHLDVDVDDFYKTVGEEKRHFLKDREHKHAVNLENRKNDYLRISIGMYEGKK